MDNTAVFILACIFIPLKRFLPLLPEQPVLRKAWSTDVIYILLNGCFIRAFFTIPAGIAVWAYSRFVGPDASLQTCRCGCSFWR